VYVSDWIIFIHRPSLLGCGTTSLIENCIGSRAITLPRYIQNLHLRTQFTCHVLQCYAQTTAELPDPKKDIPLAIFSGRSLSARADKRRQPLSALKVYPQAHNGPLFDYILLGALMIERRRLSPWHDHDGNFGFSTRRLETSSWY
jgi:hypothetical protein